MQNKYIESHRLKKKNILGKWFCKFNLNNLSNMTFIRLRCSAHL